MIHRSNLAARCAQVPFMVLVLAGPLSAARAQEKLPPSRTDPPSVPKLIEQLKAKDKTTAEAAARALGQLGPEVLPALSAAVKKEPGLTTQIGAAFTEMGAEAIPRLLDAVRQDKDERLRRAIARGLGGMGPAAAAALVEAAKDQDRYARLTAIEALDHMTSQPELPAPEKVVAALLAALTDKAEVVRQLAAQSLCRLGPKNERVLPALLKALKEDVDGRVRRAVAEGLMAVIRRGHCDSSMVEALTAAVKEDDDCSTRSAAATALGFVDKQQETAAAALAFALKDRYGVVRQAAAQGLLQLGEGAKPATEALIATLESDTYGKVQWYAAGALGAIGPNAASAVAALSKALTHKDGSVRATAAHALGQIGSGAAKAAPALVAALSDESPLVRETGARALGRINPSPEDVVPALTKLSQDESPRVRAAAKEALGKLGRKSSAPKKE